MKVILIAIGCICAGVWLTSSLGSSSEYAADLVEVPYDSSGVLNDPTGFGTHQAVGLGKPQPPPGVIGESLPEDDAPTGGVEKKPSVSGALAELHSAVKDKLHSWSPYKSHHAPQEHRQNITAEEEAKVANHTSSTSILPGEHILDGLTEEEMLGARTRIGKCTILFYGNSAWERAIRTHERHDREHGYRIHILRQQLLDDVWSKPAYILSLLLRELAKPDSERLEWLLWVDADTVLLNPHIPIDVFLPPPGSEFDDVHLVYSNDWNGLNNGVFPVRVNTWAVQLFSAIVSFRHFRSEVPLIFRDQSAMDYLMHEPAFAPHVVEAPQRWFNAYQGEHNETLMPFQIRRGDFLVHFAGVGNREERMEYWLERAEAHLDDWEVPLKSTSYVQEAKDFWSQQSRMRKQRKEELAEKRLKAKGLLDRVGQRLEDYGDRLGDDHKGAIEKQRQTLQAMMEGDNPIEKLEEEADKLEEAAQPLMSAMTEAQKQLLNAAHEAIFAGEKDLLEGRFNEGHSTYELTMISDRVRILKNLVMLPQEQWNKIEISQATDRVTEARAQYLEKEGTALAEKKKEEDERRQKAKDFIEAQARKMEAAGMAEEAPTDGSGFGSVMTAPLPSSTSSPEVGSELEVKLAEPEEPQKAESPWDDQGVPGGAEQFR